MTAQVLFFNVFSEKDPHLNAVESYKCSIICLIVSAYRSLLEASISRSCQEE